MSNHNTPELPEDLEMYFKEVNDALYPEATSTPVYIPVSSAKKLGKAYNYLYKIGRGTPKAQFFMTYEGTDGDRGFWCPRSAIISDEDNCVYVEEWCKLTEIRYK